jgi:hypothetical protein
LDQDLAPGNPCEDAISKHIRACIVSMQLAQSFVSLDCDQSGRARSHRLSLLQRNDDNLRNMGIEDRRRCKHIIHSNPFVQGLRCPECLKPC